MRKEARLCRCGLERGPRAGASVARRTIDGLALAEVGIVGRREDAATVPAQQALEVAVIYVGEKLRCSGRAELISTAWPQVVDRGSGGGSGPIFRPRAAGWPRRLAELSTVDSAAHHDFLSQRLVWGWWVHVRCTSILPRYGRRYGRTESALGRCHVKHVDSIEITPGDDAAASATGEPRTPPPPPPGAPKSSGAPPR